MSRLGQKIRQARESHRMTEKQLAKKCGVAEAFVRDVETGRKVAPESFVDKVSKILNVNINEEVALFVEPKEKKQEITVEKIIETKAPVATWEDAFSSLQKKIPIFEMDLKTIVGYKHLPIIDKKIEGYPADKVMFVKMNDNSMQGFRIRRGDILMIVQNHELVNNSIMLIQDFGQNEVRQVQKLEATKVLLVSSEYQQQTTPKATKDIQFIGQCVRVEFNLK